MGAAVPPELARLFEAPPGPGQERDEVWASFVAAHSRLIIRVARSIHVDHDAVMDSYAYVLERLRADDYRRLRDYAPDRRTKFTTWLVVVARRLCLDLLRHRYGRPPPAGGDVAVQRAVRRRLVDLVAVADPDEIATPDGDPTHSLNAEEVSRTLTRATSRLHADDRLLLKLRFDDDLSAPEIARLLGLPTPFHVYRRLTLVFGELRKALRERGIHGAEP